MRARKLALTVSLAAIALAGVAPGADAAPQKHSFRAATEKSRVLTFKLKRVKPGGISAAYLAASGRPRKRLSIRRVRRGARRGVLKVKLPRRWRKHKGTRRNNAPVTGTGQPPSSRGPGGGSAPAVGQTKLVVVLDRPAALPKTDNCGGSSLQTGLGSFSVNNWPNGCWRPYADSSPFNRRIPTGARLHPNSSGIVQRLASKGDPSDLRAGVADSESDWQHPTYYAQPGDPLYTIHCTRSWGSCEVEGMQVRIPDKAKAAGGSDGHMTVVDQASGWEYDFWQVASKPSGGGRIDISWGGRTRIDGDGLDSDATAAHFGNLAGIIRAQEMQRGRIDHALFMVVDCDNGTKVYPAKGLGSACSDRTNAPAEGMRFQLDMSSAQIDAMPVPDWKKTILRAMAEYGMYVGDTGGSPWDLEFESGSTYTSFGAEDQMVDFAKSQGIRRSGDGKYYFDVGKDIDWGGKLRVVDPCVAEGSC